MGLGRALGSFGMNTVNSYTNAYNLDGVLEKNKNSLKTGTAVLTGGLLGMAGGPAGMAIGAGAGAAASTLGFSAALGAVGAGAGAMAGGWGDSNNALAGAGVGALVGGFALPALGLAGAGAVKAGKGLYGLATAHPNSVTGDPRSSFGKAATGAARATGVGIGGVVKGVGAGVGFFGMGAAGSAKRYTNAATELTSSILKYTPERTFFDEKKKQLTTERAKLRIKPTGAMAAAGAAMVVGAPKLIENSIDDFMEIRAGQNAGVRRATPSYLNNAGANGDLVFAMHQNRRG